MLEYIDRSLTVRVRSGKSDSFDHPSFGFLGGNIVVPGNISNARFDRGDDTYPIPSHSPRRRIYEPEARAGLNPEPGTDQFRLYQLGRRNHIFKFSFNLLATEHAQTTVRCGHQALFIDMVDGLS